MNKFIDSIKHAIVEDDPDPKAATKASTPMTSHSDKKAPAAAQHETASAMATSAPVASYQGLGEETEHVYKKILAKTDFQSTAVAATIHKYLDPLAAILLVTAGRLVLRRRFDDLIWLRGHRNSGGRYF